MKYKISLLEKLNIKIQLKKYIIFYVQYIYKNYWFSYLFITM